MRWHKIQVRAGGLFHEQRSTIPAYTSSQKARMIYDSTADQIVFGSDDVGAFVKMFDDGHDVLPSTPSTLKLGDTGSEFLEVHADDFIGNLNGDVVGDLKGDVLAPNDDIILNNGTSIAAGDAEYYGDVYSANGGKCLDNGGTPSAATFTGTSQYAKYA